MTSSIASSEGSHYTFKALRHVPRRLFSPPTPTVGAVRSFRLTPCFQVTLEDVINAKHLPPLGRKEFEEYLLFKEYSIENLYFWLWFEDYKKSYFQWQHSGSSSEPSDPSPALALSYSRAKETFFTHARPYELNLTEKTVQDLLNPLRPHKGPRQHPHPDAFAAVKYEIDGYLFESLRRFTANFSGNAGRNRGLFAVFLGTIIIACGCLIIIFSVLSAPHRPRLLHLPYISRTARLASIPVLWLGFLTLLAGLQGVCILIFLFGDVRQLHAYELAKPKISPPINPRPHSHPPAVRLGRVSSDFGEEKLSKAPRPSLVLGKRGEIDMDDDDDDRNSNIFKSGLFAGTESGTSLDQPHQPQDDHGPKPNLNPKPHAQPRISVDITQHQREGSGDMLEIMLARTLEEDMYRIDNAPLSDTTIAVESNYYSAAAAAAAAAAATTATTATTADHFQQLPGAGAGADTDVEPYRFDFDALPLPAGMTLPPWQQTLLSVQPQVEQRRGVGVNGTERKIFAPLTNVLSPLITRTQWIIIVRSALIGLLLACAVGGASMAIH